MPVDETPLSHPVRAEYPVPERSADAEIVFVVGIVMNPHAEAARG